MGPSDVPAVVFCCMRLSRRQHGAHGRGEKTFCFPFGSRLAVSCAGATIKFVLWGNHNFMGARLLSSSRIEQGIWTPLSQLRAFRFHFGLQMVQCLVNFPRLPRSFCGRLSYLPWAIIESRPAEPFDSELSIA